MSIQCLPFDLATAPHVFTKILKPVLAHLQTKSWRLVAYLDDIIGRNKREAEQPYQQTKHLLKDLGFVCGEYREVTASGLTIEFLGFIINSILMTSKLPIAKLMEIRKKWEQAPLQEKQMTIQESQLHINAKDLLASFLALQMFVGDRRGYMFT